MLEGLLALDGGALLWIQNWLRTPAVTPAVAAFTHLGDGGALWIGVCLLLLCFRRTRRAGALGLGALALGGLCTNVLLKHLVARPRPWLSVAGLAALVEERDPNSFPSGHTCAAFAAAWVWLRAMPARWMGLTGLVLAAAMGFSRLYVGVHFPSDVLAGALVGMACGQAVWWIWLKYSERRRSGG